LLYECLSRKIPTGALSIRGDLLGKKTSLDMRDYNFCWPKKIEKTGPFWTNIDSDNEVLRVLNFVTFISKKKWEKVIKKFSNIFMLYDFNNKILKKEIAEISKNLDLNKFLTAKK
jgi:surface carbohydrate biosynthesis protein